MYIYHYLSMLAVYDMGFLLPTATLSIKCNIVTYIYIYIYIGGTVHQSLFLCKTTTVLLMFGVLGK